MKTRLARENTLHSLLLLLVMAQNWAVDASRDQRCVEDAIVLGEREARITAYGRRVHDHYFSLTVYLWLEEGFSGVSVQALANTATGPVSIGAWFPEDMFPNVTRAAWWYLVVSVYHNRDHVEFDVQFGDSWMICHSWVTTDNLQSVEMVGYGTSRGRDDKPPRGCLDTQFNRSLPDPIPTCTALPITTPATTPTSTTPPPTTPPPTPLPTTPQTTPEATTCPPIPVEVAEMMAVLTVLIGDMYHTLQRLEAGLKAARGPVWPETHHARPHPQPVRHSPASTRN
ncbi:uncharacterized protein LOC126995001 [Eriocheir sinensis]|uniref:uncharacterized protein LOC126995001 n=1 Tax=Eriocheir sinensis TaxID=95602 RepID=UPI0021C82AF0|nr:uncharacterized protein LOC126995001 [Eriocheir sinensis]